MVYIVIILILAFACQSSWKSKIINDANHYGILIRGVHYNVYSLYREESYTDGGVYVTHHGVKYFGEILLKTEDGDKLFVSEKHLRHCLKKRKHQCKRSENGKMTYWWSEWNIDWKHENNNPSHNIIYTWLY